MPGFKVILTNQVLEVWQYEREPFTPDNRRISADESAMTEYLLTGDPSVLENKRDIPEWIKELERKRQGERNGRAARASFRRLCLANFTGQTNFITLTFADGATFSNGKPINIRSIVDTNKAFDQFMKRLRRAFGSDFKFAVVTEFQDKTRNGVIHYHMLADLGIKWSNEEECKRLEREFSSKYWKHGFVDLKDVNHVDNIGAYMSKYMAKRMDDERLAGKKAYRTSMNCERPTILKGEEAMRAIEAMGINLEKEKEVYTSEYTSEYLGQITYKEYNLSRDESHVMIDGKLYKL